MEATRGRESQTPDPLLFPLDTHPRYCWNIKYPNPSGLTSGEAGVVHD
jgi:hypothetical protein